jgi:predicted enzyme related to lactoylglutathione lyase
MQHTHIDHAIDYIEFTAPDLPAIKKFYGDVFGWTFQDWGDEYASFSDGRVDGGFARGEVRKGAGPLVILYSSSLEALQEKVKASGGAIAKDTFSFPGGRRFHFADPAGNELAVWSDM